MPWELARRTRIRSEYIRRRLIELRLEVLAIRIKPNHALAILAEDHYLELVDFCRFDDTRAQPRDWKDFQADILSKPHSDQDELDLEQYIAARPYPSMARFHSRKMVDFTLYRPANLPATTDSRAPSLGSLKKPVAGITQRRAIPAFLLHSPRLVDWAVRQATGEDLVEQLRRKYHARALLGCRQHDLPHQEAERPVYRHCQVLMGTVPQNRHLPEPHHSFDVQAQSLAPILEAIPLRQQTLMVQG